MTDKATLLALAERVEKAEGADRELDAEIAERVYDWQPHRIPADYDGENECDVLTPDGGPFRVSGIAWSYPPKGKVHRAYHCEQYTRDARDNSVPRDYIRKATAAVIRAHASQKGV